LKEARKQVAAYQDAVRLARKEVETTGTYNPMYWLIGNKDLELARDKLKDIETQAERAKSKLEQLSKAYKESTGSYSTVTPESYKDIQTLTEKLRIQNAVYGEQSEYLKEIRTLIESMSAEQRSAADTMLLDAKRYAASLKAKEKEKGIDDLIKKAERAAAIVNMTEGQIEASSAKALGASPVVRQWLIDIYDWADAQKKAKQETEDLAKEVSSLTEELQQQAKLGAFEISRGEKLTSQEAAIAKLYDRGLTKEQLKPALEAANLIKEQEKFNKLMEQGKEVAEKFASPLDKLLKTKLDLTKMLNAGTISMEVYTKALREAEQQAHKDYTVQFKTSGVDALLMGTKEMQQALYDYNLGRMPLPKIGEKSKSISKEKAWTWTGIDTTTSDVTRGQSERIEQGKKMEGLLAQLVELAKEHWTGESLTVEPLGL
jgi:hypothetical protein